MASETSVFCCSSTRCLALSIWMLVANNPVTHPPIHKHKIKRKMLRKRWARRDNVLHKFTSFHSFAAFDSWINTQTTAGHRKKSVFLTEKDCIEKTVLRWCVSFLNFVLCHLPDTLSRISSHIKNIAVIFVDCLESYSHWGAMSLICNMA